MPRLTIRYEDLDAFTDITVIYSIDVTIESLASAIRDAVKAFGFSEELVNEQLGGIDEFESMKFIGEMNDERE